MSIVELVAEILSARLLTKQRQAQLEQMISAGLRQEQEVEAIDRLLTALTLRHVVAGDCLGRGLAGGAERPGIFSADAGPGSRQRWRGEGKQLPESAQSI